MKTFLNFLRYRNRELWIVSGERERRVAIVSGLRTPFLKQGTGFRNMSALDMGASVVAELLARSGVPQKRVGQVVFGQVLPSIAAPNIAREIVLACGLPKETDAFSVSRACATSYQSTVSAAQAILAGSVDCVVAGGADSASDIPITVSKPLASALLLANKARNLSDRLRAFAHLKGGDFLPVPPAIRELSTGLSMGQSAEKMAKENGISRREQDAFAHRSHQLAAKAWSEALFSEQVMTTYAKPDFHPESRDNLVRTESELSAYERLIPAFDKKYGTVTAGNSSPLTDGAAALLMMREDVCEELGLSPLGFLRSSAFAALDPGDQLLMGPAYAAPLALERSGLLLSEMDLIDMHEAFAAQVLSNTRAFESAKFATERLGRSTAIGSIDWDRFNVQGGSLALGHPFAATGARQILQTLLELRRRGGQFALCTACAAGGLGAAVVLEAAT
jgi:acetyl-CoA acyltransferase